MERLSKCGWAVWRARVLLALGAFLSVGAFLSAGAVPAAGQETPAPPDAATRPSPRRNWAEWPSVNLRVEKVPLPWRDHLPVERERSVTMRCDVPDMAVTIAADDSPRDSTEPGALMDLVVNRLRLNSATVEVTSRERTKGFGIDGMQAIVRTTSAKGMEFHMVAWVGYRNGRSYVMQLVTTRPFADDGRLAAAELLSKVELIDADKVFSAPLGPPMTAHVSPSMGWGVIAPPNSGWMDWTSVQATFPSADFGCRRADSSVAVFIVVPLGDLKSTQEELTDALLRASAFHAVDLQDVKPYDSGGVTGISARCSRTSNGRALDARVLVARAGEYAVLCLGSVPKGGDPKPIDDLFAGLDFSHARPLDAPALGLGPASGPAVFDPSKLPVLQRRGMSLLVNQLGLSLDRRGDPADAAKAFRRTVLLSPDLVYFTNLASAQFEAGQSLSAAQTAREAAEAYATNPKALELAATMCRRAGKAAESAGYYERLFSLEVVDDAKFAEWMTILAELGQTAKAVERAEAYRRRSDTDSAAVTESLVMMAAKQYADAVKLLQGRPFTPALGISLARAQYGLHRYEDALATLDRTGAPAETADGLTLRGMSLLSLQRDAEAKAAFDKAAALRPNDPDIAALVKAAAGRVGQGNNAAIRTPIPPVDVDPSLLLAPAELGDVDRSSGAVYLLRLNAMDFAPDRAMRTTEYERIRILDQHGAETFNHIDLSLNPLWEKLYVNAVEVRDEKGAVLATGRPEDYYVLDMPTREYASLEQRVTVPIPALRPGCEVTFTVTRERRAVSPHLEFTDVPLYSLVPTLRSAAFLRGSLGVVRSVEYGGAKREDFAGGWLWRTDRPPRYVYEPWQTWAREYLPGFTLSDAGATWEKEGLDYEGQIAGVVAVDPAIRALAERVVAGAADPQAKLAAIAEHVQRALTYKAVAFGRGARIPNEATSILKNRYGDCKDHSLLLRSMLEAVGIKCYLALVNFGEPIIEDQPSTSQFDHMIVYVPDCGGQSWCMDVTGKHGPVLRRTPMGLGGCRALVLSERPELLTIPPYAADENRIAISSKVRVGERGDVSVTERVTIEGADAAYFRGELLDAGDIMSRDERAAKSLLSDINAVRAVKTRIEGLEENDRPLVMELSYAMNRRLRSAGQRLVGEVPTLIEEALLRAEPMETRRTPFRLHSPLQMTVSMSVELPAGWELEADDAAGTSAIDDDFIAAKVQRALRPNRVIESTLAVQTKRGTFPPTRYDAMVSSYRDALEAWSEPLILRKSKGG
jgi:transglutaminase-like putative cysteine protease/tetratricopeptide (TPR) repeat protein